VNDDTLITLLTDRAQLAVARRLPVPLMAAVSALDRYTWTRDEHGYCNRSDLATVRAQTRVDRFTAEVELAPWSDQAAELVLRPAARAPHRWGARRRRRWYAHAHTAADALRHQVVTAWRADRMDAGAAVPALPRKAG